MKGDVKRKDFSTYWKGGNGEGGEWCQNHFLGGGNGS
jgi:hypothetical protein